MLLLTTEVMQRLRIDPKTLFRMAHVKLFGRDVNVDSDVLMFKQNSVVPKYVETYVLQLLDELI